MLLIINNHRGHGNVGGLGRYYRGSGMLGTITRKLFSGGIRKAISSGTSSALVHKVADTVVNGAVKKKVADAIGKEVASAAGKASAHLIDSAIKKVVTKKKKRPAATEPCAIELSPTKKSKINSIIDGSGIVYD